MRRKTKWALAIVALLSLQSCGKEGCMDEDADNYSADAEREGTCEYSADFVFYFNEEGANEYRNDPNVDQPFKIFVKDEYIGEIYYDSTYEIQHACGTTIPNYVLSYTLPMLMDIEPASVSIVARSGQEFEYRSDNVATMAGSCNRIIF